MKNLLPLVIFAVLALLPERSEAATILAVDFGAAGAEPGFLQQNNVNQTHSSVLGDINITLANVQGIFNFATTGTNDSLYRDFYFRNGGTITLTVSGPGIAANTDYDLTFWSYYGAEGRNTTFNPTAGTTGPSLGPIALSNSPAPSQLFDPLYSITGTYTSDNSGNLTILVGGTANRPAINALQIVGIVPEPSVVTLLALGTFSLFRRRRSS